MILQALKEYYDRKPYLAPPGWIAQRIDYVIVLDELGRYQHLESLQEIKGKKTEGFPCLVPNIGKQALKHTNSGIDANLLWDNASFVFGIGNKGKNKIESFIKEIENRFSNTEDTGIKAVLSFLNKGISNPAIFAPILEHSQFGEMITTGRACMTFRLLHDDSRFVFERSTVKNQINRDALASNADGRANRSVCLITGEQDQPIELCHPVIKNVWGCQTSGATIVGINKDKPAFNSFSKNQGANSPVSSSAVFAYTTALNDLLDSKQRVQVGDASTVFWAAKEEEFEQQVLDFFGEQPKDGPDRSVRAVESLFKSVQNGAYLTDENNTIFYVLGLAPNAARIAIRFWIASTVAEMAKHIRQHFIDIQIDHGPRDTNTLSLRGLLISTAAQREAKNIPPNIGGDTMRAILEGLPYPQTLLQAAIRRIRAEHDITYPRAALIKACINREIRHQNINNKEELQMRLDPNNINIGYRLGRLFAALERTQIRAFTIGGGKEPNTTIRDRYYGAASGTPVAVFATLIRLSKHHLAKIENVGERVNIEKLFVEIMEGIDDFPTHLCLADQGRFAIGYYHQMHDFKPKSRETNKGKEQEACIAQ
jgi:CRISPR-associated protein Csd1